MSILDLLVPAAAAVAAWLLTALVLRRAEALRLIDLPNARSSHSRPTPRGGGLAIVIVVLALALVVGFFLIVPHFLVLLVLLVVDWTFALVAKLSITLMPLSLTLMALAVALSWTFLVRFFLVALLFLLNLLLHSVVVGWTPALVAKLSFGLNQMNICIVFSMIFVLPSIVLTAKFENSGCARRLVNFLVLSMETQLTYFRMVTFVLAV